MIKKKESFPLVWIDMEMTGLDVEKEKIIEIATVVTDIELNIIAQGPQIVIHQPVKILRSMDKWNQNQHSKSGLIKKVKSSKINVKTAEKTTLDFIKEYCISKQSPLCGNSIHHDRTFIRKYMPNLDQFLHYRHIDVSTIKILVEAWYPRIKKTFTKNESHRALDDILESIDELRYYRKKYFRK